MYGSYQTDVARDVFSEYNDEEIIGPVETEKTSKEKRIARAKVEALLERKHLEDMLFDIFDEDSSQA